MLPWEAFSFVGPTIDSLFKQTFTLCSSFLVVIPFRKDVSFPYAN